MFGDSNFAVNTVNVRTRRVNPRITTATSFKLSNDGRWITWSRVGGEAAPDYVGMTSISGRECLLVRRPRNRVDEYAFFKPGVTRLFFLRSPYNPQGGVLGHGRIIGRAALEPGTRASGFVPALDTSPEPVFRNDA